MEATQTQAEVVPPKKGMSIWIKLVILAVIIIVVVIGFISINQMKTTKHEISAPPILNKACETQRANLEIMSSWKGDRKSMSVLTSSEL